MTRVKKESGDWAALFRTLEKVTRNDPVPYVSKLSLDLTQKSDERAFAVLISTIISLRTKDKTTEDATNRLFTTKKFTPKELLKLSESEIAKRIYPAGFYQTKAKQILKICKQLQNDFDGKVPNNLETLIGFPGVGRKTANLVLTEGFGADGICVDTHVHRILNRLGWIKTTTPDETELTLREIMPRRFWQSSNRLLVTFGQYHCKPVGPKCEKCPLKSNCKFGKSH